MIPVLLLVLSNVFMTVAWYWHIQGDTQAVAARPLLWVILVSWGIALFEYCLAVPANRIGALHGWSAGQLKITQEAIALIVFGVFMVVFLKEPLHWRHFAAFGCIMAAVAFLFTGK
ncbi:MAG: DMT family protein [Novosphingobium sp.]|nr:DMT family protein [Novosphingobium sp.]